MGRDLYPGSDHTKQPMLVSVRTTCGETESFPVRRGTIQGDTLSPLLFILFLTPLLNWLNSVDNGYTTNTSSTRVSPPAFADDMALTSYRPQGGTPTIARQLQKVSTYSEGGGMSLNVMKCAMGCGAVAGLGGHSYRELKKVLVPYLPKDKQQQYWESC